MIKNFLIDNNKQLLSLLLRLEDESDTIIFNEVRKSIKLMTKQKILQIQDQFCKPWLASDGRWKVKVPDDTKSSGYRLIARKSKENLENEIVSCWKNFCNCEKEITLETLYPEWLAYKELHIQSSSYLRRISDDWNRFYADTDIVKIPIANLDKLTLDKWAHKMIKDFSMTKTCYYNMSMIMRQSLKYACEKGYIEKSPFDKVEINTKLFQRRKKPLDSTQVFLTNEQERLEEIAIEQFHKSDCSWYLAIPLMFQLGIRAGECISLKFSDINEEQQGYIHIQRMRVAEYILDGDSPKLVGYKDVEHTKTSAGDRNIYLTERARYILNILQNWNANHGFSTEDFIFTSSKGRPRESGINYRLKKCCKLANIPARSQHKIRKTYISTLIDNPDLNINFIRSQAGHESEKTTYQSYCFNRKTDLQTEMAMETALSQKCNQV